MAAHLRLGQRGEALAAAWLEEKGYTTLHRNWRHSRFEIDLIMLQQNTVHFVEVKLRSSAAWGPPEAAVRRRKFRFLQQAADAFLHLHPEYRQVQFDILAITWKEGAAPEYFFIEDVYFD